MVFGCRSCSKNFTSLMMSCHFWAQRNTHCTFGFYRYSTDANNYFFKHNIVKHVALHTFKDTRRRFAEHWIQNGFIWRLKQQHVQIHSLMITRLASHLGGLLAVVGHLLNGHHLVGKGVSGLQGRKTEFIYTIFGFCHFYSKGTAEIFLVLHTTWIK